MQPRETIVVVAREELAGTLKFTLKSLTMSPGDAEEKTTDMPTASPDFRLVDRSSGHDAASLLHYPNFSLSMRGESMPVGGVVLKELRHF